MGATEIRTRWAVGRWLTVVALLLFVVAAPSRSAGLAAATTDATAVTHAVSVVPVDVVGTLGRHSEPQHVDRTTPLSSVQVDANGLDPRFALQHLGISPASGTAALSGDRPGVPRAPPSVLL